MKKLLFGLFVIGLTTQFGLTTQSFSQVISDGMLPEIEVHSYNYKYLNSIDNTASPVSVKLLQQKVANFDVLESDLFQDEYDYYNVSFYIPEGKIVAAYDGDGKLIKTFEKFKNIKMPNEVSKSVAKRFPGWIVSEDVYKVIYHRSKGVTKQEYKLTLENGDKRMKVKTDSKGNFI